jgi:3-oxoacyl-[acyl-carrier-protein] synthase-1
MAIKPLAVTAYTVTNALGRGIAASLTALRREESGLRPCDFEDAALSTWIGRVAGLEEDAAARRVRGRSIAATTGWRDWAWSRTGFGAAVQRGPRTRYGADRIGVFIGTSTSGIGATEHAYRQRDPSHRPPAGWLRLPAHPQSVFSAADFTRR